jgi:hypothetical protein
LQVAQ